MDARKPITLSDRQAKVNTRGHICTRILLFTHQCPLEPDQRRRPWKDENSFPSPHVESSFWFSPLYDWPDMARRAPLLE